MATLLEGSKIEEKKLQEIIGSAIDRALINGTFYNDLKRWISKNIIPYFFYFFTV